MAWFSKFVLPWLEAAKLALLRWLGRPIISGSLLVIRACVPTVRDNISDVAQEAISESTDHHVEHTQQLVSVESGHTRLPAFLVRPLKFVQRCVGELRDCYRTSSSIREFFACIWSNINWRTVFYYGAVTFYCSVAVILVVKIIAINYICHNVVRHCLMMRSSEKVKRSSPSLPIKSTDPGIKEFVAVHYPEYKEEMLSELGSRMKKNWVMLVKKSDTTELSKEPLLLTDAPVSQNCPLVLHEHQKGLNKLLNAVKEHPYIHPINEVYYSVIHEKLIIVQPYRPEGSLKDLIYKVSTPILDWSQKYASRSKGLSPEKVARYGRQILEAMQFLYEIGFPPIDHVQSGNVFVVDDVCFLGGYENTLLGYKTRIYRLCKDHLSHLDIILFGHLIFEMSAGYELTEIRPEVEDYKAVPSAFRPILEYIFTNGFPHSIREIAGHEFFDVPVEKFDPSTVHSQLSNSTKIVLEKVRKNKPRAQKPSSAVEGGTKAMFSRIHIPWPRFFKVKKDHKNANQMSVSSKQSIS